MDMTSENACTITAADGTPVPVPTEFVCPLTMDVMQKPLVSREGHSYEHDAILSWVAEHGTSPLTRQPLLPGHLMRHRALELRIQFFFRQHGVARDDTAVDKEADNATKEGSFMGFVAAPRTTSDPAPASVTRNLRDMTTTFTLTLDNDHSTHGPEDCIAVRRREISNLISSAMHQLNVM